MRSLNAFTLFSIFWQALARDIRPSSVFLCRHALTSLFDRLVSRVLDCVIVNQLELWEGGRGEARSQLKTVRLIASCAVNLRLPHHDARSDIDEWKCRALGAEFGYASDIM